MTISCSVTGLSRKKTHKTLNFTQSNWYIFRFGDAVKMPKRCVVVSNPPRRSH